MSSHNKTSRVRGGSRPKTAPPRHVSGPPRLDATNLAGITDLMNHQNVRTDANLEAAERNVMGRPSSKQSAVVDPLDLYNKELNELAAELGIDFLDGGDTGGEDNISSKRTSSYPGTLSGQSSANVPKARNPLGGNAIDALIGDLDLGSDSDKEGTDESDDGSDDGSDDDSSDDDSSDDETSDSDNSDDEEGSNSNSDSVIANIEKGLGIDLDATRRSSKRSRRVHNVPIPADHSRPSMSTLTEEQERRCHINSVMGSMRKETRTSFGVEHERVQDIKASKLEKIGQLRMTLEDDGIDCSGVETPNMSSPMDEINSVLAILKLKNDRNRYSTMAEEVILGVAEGVETVFNGTREVPMVGWKPDYTGYHNTVNAKLHRMRYETSQVVGNAIEKYNIGPTTRIAMELLPSFFLYPSQQRKQRGSPGLHADFSGSSASGTARRGQVSHISDARGAYSAIRRSDIPDSLASVADI